MNEYADNDLMHALNLKGKNIDFDGLIHSITLYYIENYFRDYDFTKEPLENDINFAALTERKPQILFEFGFGLTRLGVTPDLLEISVQNAYETILLNTDKEELQTLHIQLLFVKKAIMLFSQCRYEAYFGLIQSLVSKNFNIYQYERHFKNWK